jgi:hypothetical protein
VDTGERSVRAKQSRKPVSAEYHVGGIYYKQAQPDRVGLLCATLSKECVRLRKMSKTAHVQLKSQQKSSIKGHEVIRFTLAIELAPPTIKQTLNLNNQK